MEQVLLVTRARAAATVTGPLLLCLYIAFHTNLSNSYIIPTFFVFISNIGSAYNSPFICSLQWNTSFPAITVCEMFNGEKTWDLSEKYVLFMFWPQNATQIRFPDRNYAIVKLIQFTLIAWRQQILRKRSSQQTGWLHIGHHVLQWEMLCVQLLQRRHGLSVKFQRSNRKGRNTMLWLIGDWSFTDQRNHSMTFKWLGIRDCMQVCAWVCTMFLDAASVRPIKIFHSANLCMKFYMIEIKTFFSSSSLCRCCCCFKPQNEWKLSRFISNRYRPLARFVFVWIPIVLKSSFKELTGNEILVYSRTVPYAMQPTDTRLFLEQ